ncbi:MAG: FtsX-like permease family protein [Myxococcota bacterium]
MMLLISVAWRNLWRHTRRSLITAGAMAVGVALCMAMVAFQDGTFENLFEVMVEQQLGHVQIHHPEYPAGRVLHDTVPDAAALVEQLDGLESTAAVSGRLNGFALVGGEDKSAGAMLVGVVPERLLQTFPLDERTKAGRFIEGPGEIALGEKLAEELDVGLGDGVVVVTQAADGSLGNAVLNVVGTYRSGNTQMDRNGAYLTLGDLQELLVLHDQIHQITALTKDAEAIEPYVTGIEAIVDREDVEIQPWWIASPQTAQLMGSRDVAVFIILGIVFGAAAFGVLNTMMMSVFERTRELGVLRALGIRAGRLVALIVIESLFLAVVASAMGLGLGAVLDYYVVTVGFDMSAAAEDGFSFSGVTIDPVIKGVVKVESIVQILVAVLLVSVLASLYPAIRAANLKPVEAIRSE